MRATWHTPDVLRVRHDSRGGAEVGFRCAPVWTTQCHQPVKKPAKGASAAAKAAAKAAPADLVWSDDPVRAPEGVDPACSRWLFKGASATSLNRPIRAMDQATAVNVVAGALLGGAPPSFEALPEGERGSRVTPGLGRVRGVFTAETHLSLSVGRAGSLPSQHYAPKCVKPLTCRL
jgi:hypothetical protein